jgi:hypothetical protein
VDIEPRILQHKPYGVSGPPAYWTSRRIRRHFVVYYTLGVMKTFPRLLTLFAIAVSFSTSVWSYDLTGQWDLKIEDKNHHVVTTLVIEFTKQSAVSCIGGRWLRLNVLSSVSEDINFFPASDPLSFSIQNNQLTIGRNQTCDAYLRLQGAFDGEAARGDYYGLGLGGTWPLGFFSLSRKK